MMGHRSVLIVEDEMLVALYLEDAITNLGCDVAGVAGRLPEALALAREGNFDFALLDLNLNGARTYAVAEVLRHRGVPFAFATGYGEPGVSREYADVPVLPKPIRLEALASLLKQI